MRVGVCVRACVCVLGMSEGMGGGGGCFSEACYPVTHNGSAVPYFSTLKTL